jgi:hypothetical protein
MMAPDATERAMTRDADAAGQLIADLTGDTFTDIAAYVREQPSLVDLDFPRSLMIYAHAALFFELILALRAGDESFATALSQAAHDRHVAFWQAHGGEHGFDVRDEAGIAKVFDAAQERVAAPVRGAINKLVFGDQAQGQTDIIVSILALVVEPPVREEDLVSHVAPLLQPYLTRVEPLLDYLTQD